VVNPDSPCCFDCVGELHFDLMLALAQRQ
jgi:hypothetical protein